MRTSLFLNGLRKQSQENSQRMGAWEHEGKTEWTECLAESEMGRGRNSIK